MIEQEYRSDEEYKRILQEEKDGLPAYTIGGTRVSMQFYALHKLYEAMCKVDEAIEEKQVKLPKPPYTPIIVDPADEEIDVWVR